MKKRYWIIGASVVLLAIVGGVICRRTHVSIDKNGDGTSVSITGGADGTTSVSIIGGADGTTAVSIIGGADETSSISITGGADGPTSIFLAGKLGDKEEADKDDADYTQIAMSETKDIFAEPGDYIILDVRREDEYASGHIPGAINIANESIKDAQPEELTDKNQTIYVYCRSGNRSKMAAQKLADMGYTNVIECGGIKDWTGKLEKE